MLNKLFLFLFQNFHKILASKYKKPFLNLQQVFHFQEEETQTNSFWIMTDHIHKFEEI